MGDEVLIRGETEGQVISGNNLVIIYGSNFLPSRKDEPENGPDTTRVCKQRWIRDELFG